MATQYAQTMRLMNGPLVFWCATALLPVFSEFCHIKCEHRICIKLYTVQCVKDFFFSFLLKCVVCLSQSKCLGISMKRSPCDSGLVNAGVGRVFFFFFFWLIGRDCTLVVILDFSMYQGHDLRISDFLSPITVFNISPTHTDTQTVLTVVLFVVPSSFCIWRTKYRWRKGSEDAAWPHVQPFVVQF